MEINKVLESDMHRKIVTFFHENQTSIDTPRGIATWIGEDRSKVKIALEDLAKLKILIAHRSTSTTGYSYTREKSLISKISKLLRNF